MTAEAKALLGLLRAAVQRVIEMSASGTEGNQTGLNISNAYPGSGRVPACAQGRLVGDSRHQQDLAEADRLIAASMGLISRQRALIERVEKDGFDSTEARKLLRLFEETLELMQAYREITLRAGR